MVFVGDISIVDGVYKRTFSWRHNLLTWYVDFGQSLGNFQPLSRDDFEACQIVLAMFWYHHFGVFEN